MYEFRITMYDFNKSKISDYYSHSSEQLKELDKRIELHDSGKAIYYTKAEMTKIVLAKKKK